MKNKGHGKIMKALFYILAFGYAVIALFPFIWSFLTSLRPTNDVYNIFIDFSKLSFDNYSQIVQNAPILRWFFNSIVIAISTTVLSVLVNSMMGYALARIKFRANNMLFLLVIGIMMIPGQITLIPTYMLLNQFKLINNYAGFILPTIFSSFNVFMMRQFFLSIPVSLEEAAKIDGLSRIKIFFKIALPLAKPALASITIMTFMGSWNNFLFPSLMATKRSMFTLPVGMSTLSSQYIAYPNQTMTSAILISIPMILMFLIFQRYFIEGIAQSGSKE